MIRSRRLADLDLQDGFSAYGLDGPDYEWLASIVFCERDSVLSAALLHRDVVTARLLPAVTGGKLRIGAVLAGNGDGDVADVTARLCAVALNLAAPAPPRAASQDPDPIEPAEAEVRTRRRRRRRVRTTSVGTAPAACAESHPHRSARERSSGRRRRPPPDADPLIEDD